MASTWETGHGVNIANFRVLIERCEEFGAAYQPVNEEISIVAMRTRLSAAEALQREYFVALDGTKIPINDRELLFGEIKKTAVRAVNIYKASKAAANSIEDVKGFMGKLTGRNVKVKRLEDGSRDPKSVSNSQQSYVKKVEHLTMLIGLLKHDVHYAPNEEALQIESLEALLARAKAANEAIFGLMAQVDVSRTARDHALYDPGTGLVDLSMACKHYVKALFGGKSPETKSVVGVSLRRRMRMRIV